MRNLPGLALAAFGSLFILGLIDNVRGPFYPDILNDFGVTSTKGSLFFALTSLFAFLGSLFAHRLEHRWTSLHVLIGASMVFSVGFIAIALSPGWIALCISAALFGLAFGTLNLAQNTLVLQSSPGSMRRRMMNGLHSMYGLAAMVAPLTASLFRAMGFNWRMTFLILAILPWILLALIGHFLKRPPKDFDQQRAIPLYADEWKTAFLYGLMVAGYLWAEISITTRLVQWLRQDLGYGPDLANFYLGSFCGLLLAGRVIFSLVHFPALSNWDVLRASSLLASVLFALGLWLHPVILIFSGLAMAPFFPVAMEQINTHFGEKGAQALGFVIGFGSLSVVAMHLIIGWTTDHWGLTRSLYLCAAGVAIVFVALSIMHHRGRHRAGLRL